MRNEQIARRKTFASVDGRVEHGRRVRGAFLSDR